MKKNNKKILDKISSMTLIEIIELINDIEKKFGIDSKNYQLNNNIGKDETKEIKKKEFDLYLDSIGNNKIAVIKIVRSFLNLGLKESKDLVESCPVLIKNKIKEKESNLLKKSLEEVGAKVILK